MLSFIFSFYVLHSHFNLSYYLYTYISSPEGKAVPGQWHTIVIGAHWHNDTSKGWFKVVYDKEVVVKEKQIQPLPDIDNRTLELRVGLYPTW